MTMEQRREGHHRRSSQVPARSVPAGLGAFRTSGHQPEPAQIYGSTLKALVHEKFVDGLISTINFKLDLEKVDDPEGGSRAVITIDGKYLPTKPF